MTVGKINDLQKNDKLIRLVRVRDEYERDIPEIAAENIDLEIQDVDLILSNLKSGADLARVIKLKSNKLLCSRGFELGGRGFIVSCEIAQRWICINSQLNRVIKPFVSGNDIADRAIDKYVIDFDGIDLEQVCLMGEPYQHLLENVNPVRAINQEKIRQENGGYLEDPVIYWDLQFLNYLDILLLYILQSTEYLHFLTAI